MVELAALLAILLLMAFTPLGYLQIGILAISLLSIPVAIGAVHLGVFAGTLLGTVFGLTSLIRAISGINASGAVMFNLNPAGYIWLAVGTRFLMGLCTALIFKGLVKLHVNIKAASFAGCLAAPVLNTIFYMTAFVTVFHDYCVDNLGMTAVFSFIITNVGINGVIEALCGCLAGGAITVGLRAALKNYEYNAA